MRKDKGQLLELKDILFKIENNRKNISDYWNNEFLQNPFSDNIYITVDLILGDGKNLRLSTNKFKVKNGSEEITYMPFLAQEPSITSEYSLLAGDAGKRSISLTMDGRMIEAKDIVSSGSFITGVGEICLQRKDGDYNQRLVLLRGIISGGVTFGTNDQPVTLSLGDASISNDLILPEYYITEEDFPHMADDQYGKRMPLILGSFDAGVPCGCVRQTQNDYGPQYLIAYGWHYSVSSVSITKKEISSSDPERGWQLVRDTTLSGIPYSYLDFVMPASVYADPNMTEESPTSGLWPEGTVEVYASVQAHPDHYLSSMNALNQMQMLLTDLTGFGYDGFDWEIFARSQVKDPGLKIQTLINASDIENITTTLEYVQNTFTDSFPMLSLIYSRVGVGIVFTDRKSPVVFEKFIRGKNGIIDRSSLVSETPSEDVFNSFTLNYSFDPSNDSYKKTVTVDHTNNELCRISYTKLGKRQYDLIESVTIYDDATANYVVNWLASHISLPRYQVEYIAAPSLFLRIRVGDNIQITDDQLGWKDVTATITSIVYSKTSLIIKLDVWVLYNKIENISGAV